MVRVLAKNEKVWSSIKGPGRERRKESCHWDSRSIKASIQSCPSTPASQGTKASLAYNAFRGSPRASRSQAREREVRALPHSSQPVLPANSQPLPTSHLPGLIIFPGSCVIPVL